MHCHVAFGSFRGERLQRRTRTAFDGQIISYQPRPSTGEDRKAIPTEIPARWPLLNRLNAQAKGAQQILHSPFFLSIASVLPQPPLIDNPLIQRRITPKFWKE